MNLPLSAATFIDNFKEAIISTLIKNIVLDV